MNEKKQAPQANARVAAREFVSTSSDKEALAHVAQQSGDYVKQETVEISLDDPGAIREYQKYLAIEKQREAIK